MTKPGDESQPDKEMHLPVKFQDLIDRARDGEHAALNELFENCQDYLLFIANHQLDQDLHAKIGASDVVQETMMVAHNKFGNFEGSTRKELLGWLRGILVNDLRTTHRHYKQVDKRQVEREDNQNNSTNLPNAAGSIYTPGTQASIAEESTRLNAAISELSEEYQLVLKLRNWQQLQFSEIGEEIGKTAEAARKIWTRAVLELEKKLIYINPMQD